MKSKKKEITELNNLKKEINSFFEKVLPHLIASFLVLIIFLIVVNAYEYLTTEYWWLQDSISYLHNTIFLIVLIILLSIPDWSKVIKKRKWLSYLISILFLITLLGHKFYFDFYLDLQTYPKIKSISKDWGLAGSWVKLEGRNFGNPHQEGKVFLGDEEMIIKKWDDKEIIFEIPIRDIKGNFEINVENHHARVQTEKVRFEVR